MGIRLVKPQVEPEEDVLLNPPDEEEILILQLRRAKQNKTQAEQAIVLIEQRLIELAGDRKTLQRGGFQATLAKVLGPEKWSLVTKQVLDRGKLESAISLGTVSVEDVAKASLLVPAKPYVRVSEVVEAADT
jgi:hypothetical protein